MFVFIFTIITYDFNFNFNGEPGRTTGIILFWFEDSILSLYGELSFQGKTGFPN